MVCSDLSVFLTRYFYPFPMAPMLYQVELAIGGQQFHGKGRTRQAAKHDAAGKALKYLQHEPLPSKPEVRAATGCVHEGSVYACFLPRPRGRVRGPCWREPVCSIGW